MLVFAFAQRKEIVTYTSLFIHSLTFEPFLSVCILQALLMVLGRHEEQGGQCPHSPSVCILVRVWVEKS